MSISICFGLAILNLARDRLLLLLKIIKAAFKAGYALAGLDFKRGDLLADGRRCDAQFTGGSRNAPGSGGCVENSDGAQRQVHLIV